MIGLFIYLIISYTRSLSLSTPLPLFYLFWSLAVIFLFSFSPHCFCHRYCWELLAAALQSCAVICHTAEVEKKHLLLMLPPSLYLTVSDLYLFIYLLSSVLNIFALIFFHLNSASHPVLAASEQTQWVVWISIAARWSPCLTLTWWLTVLKWRMAWGLTACLCRGY